MNTYYDYEVEASEMPGEDDMRDYLKTREEEISFDEYREQSWGSDPEDHQ